MRHAGRQRGLELAQAVGPRRWRRRRRPSTTSRTGTATTSAIGGVRGRGRRDRRGRAPRGARWARRSPDPVVIDDDVVGQLADALAARAVAPTASASPRSTRRGGRCRAAHARRLLRHRVPRDDPGRRARLRAPADVARPVGRLRRFGFHGLSHAYASRRAAELARSTRRRAADRLVPPRRGRVAVRRPRRADRSTRRWGSRRSTGS